MTQFSYKAVSAAGEVLHGQMDAASVEEVIAHLQDQGHTPLQAQLAEGVGASGGLAGWFKRGPFSGDELAQFTHQLATLLGAGQPLDRALGLLLELPEGERAKKLVARVRDRVRGGSTLSVALEEEHGVFPKLYISLVRAGELGGSLEETLRRLADYVRFAGQRIELRLSEPVESRQVFTGVLQVAQTVDGAPALSLEYENQAGEPQTLPFSFDDVDRARLDPVLDFKGKKR